MVSQDALDVNPTSDRQTHFYGNGQQAEPAVCENHLSHLDVDLEILSKDQGALDHLLPI